jgi:SAM-dependent methyltransferase
LVAGEDWSVPLDPDFGHGRGTPIDRHYIEQFLSQHAADIRGHALEIGDDGYSRRFGQGRITRQEVLHVVAGTPGATIIGDLTEAGVLPEAALDCVVLTQTLHLIFDMRAAVRQIRRSLKPGGVALITVPGITPVDRHQWKDSWYWSLTGPALWKLLAEAFEPGRLTIDVYGNLYAATAFLHGAAVEEVDRRKLAPQDSAYPVIVAARAVA